jgi:diguanylate cyclase (GGDEF)-like protein
MKLLILEDSKALAKILSIKISKEINFEIFIANTLAEAKTLIEEHHFTIATLDLFLSDAKEDEVVDFFLEKSIPSIVMTGSHDNILQERISKKDIIDYVLKDRAESIDYMIAHIKRVIKNQSHTALIVDDSALYRQQIQNILSTQLLKTITASNGQEALDILRENRDITLLVTDYNMPVVNGLDLAITIRKERKKDKFPIIGISSDNLTAITFLKHGVNDFVNKPFFKEELSTRVNNTLDAMDNIAKLNTFAYTDFLTQVANRKAFYHDMISYYHKSKLNNTQFALAMIDIDFFKKVNDTYGHDVGDEVIKLLAKTIKENIKGRDIVARFGGEEFCVVLKDIPSDSAQMFFESLREKVASLRLTIEEGKQISFTISIGVTTLYHDNLDEMIKASDTYLYEAKTAGRNRVCFEKEISLA